MLEFDPAKSREDYLNQLSREYIDPKIRAFRCGFDDGIDHAWAKRHVPDGDYEAGFARGYELVQMESAMSHAGETA